MKKITEHKKLKVRNKGIKASRKDVNSKSLNSYDFPEIYVDENKICRACRQQFMFTAEQKRHMYEVVKLHIAVKKIICEKCRVRLIEVKEKIKSIEEEIKPKGYVQSISLASVLELVQLHKEKKIITQRADAAKVSRLNKLIMELAE